MKRKRGRASWYQNPADPNVTILEQADRDLLDSEVPDWRRWPIGAIERALARIKADIAQELERRGMTAEERKARVAKDRQDLFG